MNPDFTAWMEKTYGSAGNDEARHAQDFAAIAWDAAIKHQRANDEIRLPTITIGEWRWAIKASDDVNKRVDELEKIITGLQTNMDGMLDLIGDQANLLRVLMKK